MSSALFYAELSPYQEGLKAVLALPGAFQAFPSDWEILITDIQGSTKAVSEGRFRDVNTVAASSVIACLNIAKKHPGIQLAFAYGGDGATILVPKELLQEINEALAILQENTKRTQGLVLRVGSLSVARIYDAGHELKVAKLSIAPGYDQAVFLGEGFAFADKVIKADLKTSSLESSTGEVDLTGLMCRWNEIRPPRTQQEVVCAIIQALDPRRQARVYQEVLGVIEEIYGSYQDRHPIHVRGLVPSIRLKNLLRKSELMKGSKYTIFALSECIRAVGSFLVFRLGIKIGGFDPVTYVQDLVAATDTLHLTGTLYTAIKGTEEQRLALRTVLDRLEAKGELIYGTSSSQASVLTCYVQKYDDAHVHFLDGAGGGYTEASKEFKQKRKSMEAKTDRQ